MNLTSFKKIYVLGAGAVGCFFGGMLARANQDVTLIARPERTEAISKDGLLMDCLALQEVVQIKVTSNLNDLSDADLILLTVKSSDTEKLMHEIATIVPRHTLILSLQNGVANAEIATSIVTNSVYPAVVYVACGMMDQRTVKHHGRGELLIGSTKSLSGDEAKLLNEVCTLFARASIPCVIAKDIKRDMWLKFLVNCSYNGISGIGQICYGEMVKIPEINQLIESITKEFLAIAECEGVYIDPQEARNANDLIAKTMATQVSSTAQDLAKKKKTEIEYLNGYIVELGKRHQIATPSNASVYAMVKMLESRYVS